LTRRGRSRAPSPTQTNSGQRLDHRLEIGVLLRLTVNRKANEALARVADALRGVERPARRGSIMARDRLTLCAGGREPACSMLAQGEDVMIRTKRLLAAASAACWLVAGFANAQDAAIYGKSDPSAKRGGRMTIGSLTEPPALDPYHQGADARIRVTVLSYQGLFYEDASGDAIPLLAESWSRSADGLAYTFKLRRGVRFHTGATMTSADVKYSYDYLRNPANGSPGAGDFSTVESIDAPDADTVVFKLSRPNAALPISLTHRYGGVIPKDYFAGGQDARARLNEVSVGTGPYKLKQFTKNSVLVFERHADFWQGGLPHADEVTFAFMPNSAAMVVAAQNRRIDMGIFTRPQDAEQLTRVPGLKLVRTSSMGQRSLDLDSKYAPIADVRVRQAIASAIDKDAVMKVSVAGYGQVLGTTVAGMQDKWGVPIAELPNQKVDLDRARRLLAEAGVGSGFEIDLTTIIGYDWMDPAAVTIADQLQRIGIKVNIKKIDLGLWIRNFQSKQMGFTFNDWPTSPDPSLLYYRHFRAAPLGADFRNWNNARASDLLDRGREESDFAKRKTIYADFQKLLADEVPTIMLFSADHLTVERDRLRNHQQHPTGWYFGVIKSWLAD
jgi:peptide/nickel transport system substrate-binding protein